MDRRLVSGMLIFGLLLLATVLLAGGLDQVRLHPGIPFSLAGQTDPNLLGIPHPVDNRAALVLVIRAILTLLLVLIPFYILIHLRSREGRLKLLAEILFIAAILWLLSTMPDAQEETAAPALPGSGGAPVTGGHFPSGPPATFSVHPPDWATALTVLVIAFLVAAGFFWLARAWSQWKMPAAEPALEEIADQAGRALVALQAGGDLKNIVLRCYAEMNRVVREQRGLSRAPFLTPLEFEEALVAAGLPSEPVRGLTRLFEDVRYGAKAPGFEEESRAVHCLTEIVAAGKRLA